MSTVPIDTAQMNCSPSIRASTETLNELANKSDFTVTNTRITHDLLQLIDHMNMFNVLCIIISRFFHSIGTSDTFKTVVEELLFNKLIPLSLETSDNLILVCIIILIVQYIVYSVPYLHWIISSNEESDFLSPFHSQYCYSS